jgi:hypothetical protein
MIGGELRITDGSVEAGKEEKERKQERAHRVEDER